MRDAKDIVHDSEHAPNALLIEHLRNRIRELEEALRLERSRTKALRSAVRYLMALTREQS